MRLQILPLVLCLFMSVFLNNGLAYSKDFKVKDKTEQAVKKQAELPTNKNVGTASVDATTVNTLPTEISESNDIAQLKEKSYNYVVNEPQNSSFEQVKSTAAIGHGSVFFKQGMFYGFALMVILLNLLSYFLFEEKVFFYYSLALLGTTVTYFFSEGLGTLIGFESFEMTSSLETTLLFIAVGLMALFTSKYLNLSEHFPKMKWFTIAIMGTAGLFVFTSWFSENPNLTGIASTMLFVIMTAYFLSGVALFSRKNYAKFYVIGYGIPLLFATDYFIFQNLGINFLNTEPFHLKAAAIIEMLILTYAIVFRMRAIKEEHQLRQTEMRIFLKRQEVMNRQNVERLMEDMYLENLIMHYDLDGLEVKLLQYISEGKDNSKIGRKLKMTEEEIEGLTKDLYHKLEISEHIQEDYRIVDAQPDYIYN